MTSDNPGIISHISVGTNDFTSARAFYDPVMATLGCKPVMEYEDAVAYGRQFPEFWVQAPKDGKPATIGNGSHVGFIATSKAQVHAFYEAAMANGGADDGPPGPREEYTPAYYGCFVLDPDGHQIEATFWDEALYQQLQAEQPGKENQ
jgi:catechol 2,3-dioxygenase-like lactoylglutathione lyase family enzyme